MNPKEAIKQLEDLQGYVFSETGHLPNDEDEMAISVLIEAFKKIQWIPCSERLPEDNEEVLISAYGVCEIARLVGRYWLYGARSLDRGAVDAWMPLPEPYKEVDDETMA